VYIVGYYYARTKYYNTIQVLIYIYIFFCKVKRSLHVKVYLHLLCFTATAVSWQCTASADGSNNIIMRILYLIAFMYYALRPSRLRTRRLPTLSDKKSFLIIVLIKRVDGSLAQRKRTPLRCQNSRYRCAKRDFPLGSFCVQPAILKGRFEFN